ncbi:MAG: CBS domain-containing protein [Anaerolineae bacterium]|jgi:acetoin utilization protein AcuB|nr:CBS domain-containing protein [Anaerolineae bacterium]
MIVKERMSHPVKTVFPETSVVEALKRMEKEHINLFPVIDEHHGKMIGIVSKNDLLKASPSAATTLSQWEITSLVEKIHVKDVMTKNPITVTEDTVVEEAARIMVDDDVNGLPVMRNKELVGIITDGDIFEMLMEMLGARNKGMRVCVLTEEKEGVLFHLTKAIYEAGGNIVSMSTFMGESTSSREIVFKVVNIKEAELRKVVQPYVKEVLYVHHFAV